MKRFLTVIYVCFFLLMFGLSYMSEAGYTVSDLICEINPNDYARITDMEYSAVVSDNGTITVTERLTFDVHAASKSNGFWELWRDLVEEEVDGLKVHYQVNSVKQILPDGTEVIYGESPQLYWEDEDYVLGNPVLGPGKWYHSPGPYNETMRRYECVFFYINNVYREEMVFEIEYEMYNAALKYNDCSDLYLAMYSGDTIEHLKSLKAEILFPNDIMPAEDNYEVFTYGTDSHTFPVKESADRNPGYYTFYFELDEDDLQFHPYNQYVEIDIVAFNEDKHIFTQGAQSNLYTGDDVLDEIWDEQEAYLDEVKEARTKKIIVFIVLSLIGAGILFYGIKLDRFIKKKHYFCDPVDIQYFREIPSDLDPNFVNTLVHCKHKKPKDDSGVYSAILLSLERKGYIELQEIYKDVMIKITRRPTKPAPPVHPTSSESVIGATVGGSVAGSTSGESVSGTTVSENDAYLAALQAEREAEAAMEPLTPCEAYYYNLLVGHAVNNEVSMSTLQWRVANDTYGSQSFVKNMDNAIGTIGVQQNYFQKLDYKQPQKQIRRTSTIFMVLGILSITLVNFISHFTRLDFAFGGYTILGICFLIAALLLRKKAGRYVLLTNFGEEEYAKWRGLYNFLNSQTLIDERTFVEVALWEKYLIYATAFGISEKVSVAIGLRCPELATETSPVLRSGCYRSTTFRSHSRSFHSSVRSSGGGSFGGGGFGYGGGGRGGGGGGGGH